MLFVNLSLRTYTSLSTHGEALVLLARNLTLFLIYLIHFLSIRQAKLSRTLLLLGGNGLWKVELSWNHLSLFLFSLYVYFFTHFTVLAVNLTEMMMIIGWRYKSIFKFLTFWTHTTWQTLCVMTGHKAWRSLGQKYLSVFLDARVYYTRLAVTVVGCRMRKAFQSRLSLAKVFCLDKNEQC